MNTKPVRLCVKGTAISSFKNSKMLTRGRLITKPEYQKQMELIIQSFASQLRCFIRTNAVVMETARLAHCLTVWSQQFDDSRQWIPEIQIKAMDCAKGEEGAIIEIYEL